MDKNGNRCSVRLSRAAGLIPPLAICALMAILLNAAHAPGADFAATVRIGLTRSDARKFLLRATAPGGSAWFSLDTGAPVSCADETKATLFKFQPLPPDARPQSIMMTGQPEKLAFKTAQYLNL